MIGVAAAFTPQGDSGVVLDLLLPDMRKFEVPLGPAPFLFDASLIVDVRNAAVSSPVAIAFQHRLKLTMSKKTSGRLKAMPTGHTKYVRYALMSYTVAQAPVFV